MCVSIFQLWSGGSERYIRLPKVTQSVEFLGFFGDSLASRHMPLESCLKAWRPEAIPDSYSSAESGFYIE